MVVLETQYQLLPHPNVIRRARKMNNPQNLNSEKDRDIYLVNKLLFT